MTFCRRRLLSDVLPDLLARCLLSLAFACPVLAATATAAAAATTATGGECVVPAKPGGGMDITCKLAQQALQNGAPLHISYLPGGIGAVAWASMVTQRRSEGDTLVAFSGGSLLNLAQGKFGNATPGDVRWVAALGSDYGMIAVRRDSPYQSLRQLLDAIKRDPSAITIGTGGTAGSQDWLKMALLAKRRQIDPKSLRFVAFEGGGESFTALLAGHVQVVSGDASEAMVHALDGKLRILAVLSDARLPGALAEVQTAREQGFDVSWPTIRGVYMGPKVSDADYRMWVERFAQLMRTPAFDRQRAASGLYPFAMTGTNLSDYIRSTVEAYRRQAVELDLVH